MQTIWPIITGFFKWTWRLLNFSRILIVNIFFIFLLLVCAGIWMHICSLTQAKHTNRGALLLDISGAIVDKPVSNNRPLLLGHSLSGSISERLQENSLFEIVTAIRQATGDRNISGIVLDLKKFTTADQSAMQYIGKALKEFRDTGKPVIAVGNSYSQEQYFLASFSDKIWLSPCGRVDLHGFASNALYYKSLLDKLKITTHIFRVGAYKSAVEPFIRDGMSPGARKVDSRWIRQIWNDYLITVAENRHITPQKIFPGAQVILEELQKLGGDAARYALNNNLVDILATSVDIEKALTKQFGWNKEDKSFSAISFYNYLQKKPKESGDSIAVIFVNGTIVDGEETGGNIGGDTIAAQIRDARFNPKVKAIVLRVNSPGGSLSASEVIRTELMATRSAGKPVVVSMGGMAASGGYWISTPANYIIASQSTLTGSIGIFGMINTVENSLDYLGIHTDGVATSPLADISLTKSLPPEISKMMQLSIENGYKYFIKLVAESRKATPEQVEKISQGQVWSGQDAKNIGLVDQLGDIDDAIAKAAELAHLQSWCLDYYQDKATFFDALMDRILGSLRTFLPSVLKGWVSPPSIPLSAASRVVKAENDKFATFNDPQNRYAFCLACSYAR